MSQAARPPASRNPFSHVDQRVGDLDAGVAFYGAVLPHVGFPRYVGGKAFRCWTTAEGGGPSQPWFGITEDENHRAGTGRVAFWAASREGVDEAAAAVKAAGALNISGPRDCPEYTESYYAVFFEDPWGNPLEVLHYLDD